MLSLLRAAPSVCGARISPSIIPFQSFAVRHFHPRANRNEEQDDADPDASDSKRPFRGNSSSGNRPFAKNSRFGDKPRFGDRKPDFNRGGDRPGGNRGGFRREEGRDGRGFQDRGRPQGEFRGNDRRPAGEFRGGNRQYGGKPYNQGARPGKFSEDRFAPKARNQFEEKSGFKPRNTESGENPGSKKLENWSGPNKEKKPLTPEQKKAIEEQKATEVTVHGFHACMAIFHRRPESIAKVYITEETLVPFKQVLKYLAEKNIGYSALDNAQLEKVASTEHHEGVAFVVKKKELMSVEDAIQKGTVSSLDTKDLTQPCLLFLDNLRNPHNMGALVRSAAFFGVQTVFTYTNTNEPVNPLTAAAYRTAQGGAESVDIAAINNEEQALSTLRKLKQKGCKIITTTSHFNENSTSMYSTKGAEIFLPTHPIVLLVGNEREGVSPALAAHADAAIRIPSTGWVESLNVVQAASVIFGELFRARGGSLASHVPSSLQQDLETAREKWRNKPKIEKSFGSRRESAAESDFKADLEQETQRLAEEIVEKREKKTRGQSTICAGAPARKSQQGAGKGEAQRE